MSLHVHATNQPTLVKTQFLACTAALSQTASTRENWLNSWAYIGRMADEYSQQRRGMLMMESILNAIKQYQNVDYPPVAPEPLPVSGPLGSLFLLFSGPLFKPHLIDLDPVLEESFHGVDWYRSRCLRGAPMKSSISLTRCLKFLSASGWSSS